jgi:acyl-coenzyme A thioesterase PaaI-like protein
MADELAVDAQVTEFYRETVPFAAELGLEFLRNTKEEVRARMAWTPARCTVAGTMHGGALMALADTAGAVCAFGEPAGRVDRDHHHRVEDELPPRGAKWTRDGRVPPVACGATHCRDRDRYR